MDHEQLLIGSLHAGSGWTFESDEEELIIETFEDGELIGQGFSAPFISRRIYDYLEDYAPCGRVVLDSVSGLRPMAESREAYRRGVLDLIQLLSDEFEATTLFTAESRGRPSESGASGIETLDTEDAIQFNTHGVVRLWRENVRGDYHRFLDVMKMRGVDHDTRTFEIEFTETGVSVLPRSHDSTEQFGPTEYLSTGIDGLDTLLGEGIGLGDTLLLEHDGKIDPLPFVLGLLRVALDNDMAIVFVPPVEFPPKNLTEEQLDQAHELMEDDRLFLLDFPNIWENTRRNVFKPTEHEGEDPAEVFRTIADRRGERPMFTAVSVEAQLPILDTDELRRLRFWEAENSFQSMDTSLYFFTPHTMDEQLATFYENSARQVLQMWRTERGLPYLKLEKSSSGFVGSTRLIEYIDDEPYVRVQQPSRSADDH